jgi:hypothetical protein
MNPLESLKDKLKIKPTVEERKRVDVVIKGQSKNPVVPKEIKSNTFIGNLALNLGVGLDQEKEEIVKTQSQENVPNPQTLPIIIDETSKGYNREDLLKKILDNKLSKVKSTILLEKPKSPIIVGNESKLEEPQRKKAKKFIPKQKIIIEEEEEQPEKLVYEAENQKEDIVENINIDIPNPKESSEEIIILPKKTERKTKKIEKGIAILGPETIVKIGDIPIDVRLPKKSQRINIKVSSYYMNNREIFVNFINSLFEPYRREIEDNKANISCDTIGNDKEEFSLLTHQKIVRDYMNLYTPYRGLLLYHGLGSGKSCTSIAIAEGMKDSKKIIIMLPASLRVNYMEEMKKCGDSMYKKNQFWEWISLDSNPDSLNVLSSVLNLPIEFIQRNKGAWLVNITKKSNYSELSGTEKKTLDLQLDEMIRSKYTFINYNGLRTKRLEELTSGFTRNLFDNCVVIIDEAHNLISRIVNKLKKEKDVVEGAKGEKDYSPRFLSVKLYEYLLSAKNARIVLLSGTPVINYPNEFGILFNILRGYIKTWTIPLDVKTSKKIDRNSLYDMLLGEKSLDFLDYSPSSKMLTITRNPFGFKNKIKKESGYQGVSNNKKNDQGEIIIDTDVISDEDFERKIISILRKNDVDVLPQGIRVSNKKALPDKLELFEGQYIDSVTKELKNTDALKRRIIGLSSYFRSAQESLLPRYNKTLGVDYHIVRIPMSLFQFKIYEDARKEERKLEGKPKKVVAQSKDDLYKDPSSTYRIFSRLFCNFVMPNRPTPGAIKAENIAKGWAEPVLYKDGKIVEKEEKGKEEKGKEEKENNTLLTLLKEARDIEDKQDVNGDNEGEIEGDEILDKIGGQEYKERLQNAIHYIEEHAEEFLTPEALKIYSPKYLNILENIKDPDHLGLHLIYSQFRTLEGIGMFSLVLEKNGFTRFKLKKNNLGIWSIDISPENLGKPTYALYTGTETAEEKEIIRNIYNSSWSYIPTNIANDLKKIANNNNMGEIIKVLMITSSGSEGINLRNTRYVHIMEPYWHPVRMEQVIGRARRICSHKDLPLALQTVEVFVYLMIFSAEQLKTDDAIELKRKDLSKSEPKVPFTSDQYLYEISEIKGNLTAQLTDAIKESSFDCYIYSNGKCMNFGDPNNTKFSFVPDYSQQQSDITVQNNKKEIEWVGKPITLNGIKYVYRRISKSVLNIYDFKSYEDALKGNGVVPVQIGTLEINNKGEQVFRQLVT